MTVKVKSIEIDQAEGRVDRMIHGLFPTFDKANKALRQVQYQCYPGMLGYLKTDVVIEWEDGSTHKLRADVKGDGTDTDVGKHLLGWATFTLHGGPPWVDPKRREMFLRNTQSTYGSNYPGICEHARRLLDGELQTADS